MNLPVRVADGDRQPIVDRLCRACGSGLLTLDEFEERVGLAYGVTDRAELDRLVADLPAEAQVAVPTPASARRWSISLLGSVAHRGRWLVPTRFLQIGLIGGTELDLGTASLASPDTTITVVTLVGGSDVRVPDHVNIEVSGFSVLGSKTIDRREASAPGAPLVRLKVYSILGSTRVRSTKQ
jgi:hypothetical protein